MHCTHFAEIILLFGKFHSLIGYAAPDDWAVSVLLTMLSNKPLAFVAGIYLRCIAQMKGMDCLHDNTKLHSQLMHMNGCATLKSTQMQCHTVAREHLNLLLVNSKIRQ